MTSITGVVQDPDGEPISRAFLQIEVGGARAVPMPWQETDARGRFEIKDVPEGVVKLRAVAGHTSLFSKVGKVVETRGGVRDLLVTLETGRELRLKIEPYEHGLMGPRNGARLVWDMAPQAVHDEFRWAPIAEDGSIRFVQLPNEASFEVWGRVSVDKPFKESGLAPGKKVSVIRPKSGLTISGSLLPAKVAVEDDPTIYAEAYPGFIVAEGHVRRDGTFVIRGLPEGEYIVGCELRSSRRDGLSAGKIVRAGATDVILDFGARVR